MAPSSSGGGGGGSYYVPTGLQTADQQWQDIQNANIGLYSSQTPYLADYGTQSLNQGYRALGNYGNNLQMAADTAGAQYGVLGGQLQGAANNQFAAGNQLYQTAFDPQGALYNRTLQQLQDQTGATNSMYGLGSSAAGAGVANQALSNFNIDWQNNQLQRQLQGVQGAGQAYGQGGSLGQAGAQSTYQSSQLPFQTAQNIAAIPGQLGNTYGQYLQSNIYGPGQGFQSQAIPYMNAGIGAQGVPYQNAYNSAQAAGGAAYSGINQAAQGLGNAFQNSNAYQNWANPASGSFSGGDFSGAFTSSPYYSGANSYGFTM